MVLRFGFERDGIRAVEPVSLLEFLQLEAGARGWALKNSGGGPGRKRAFRELWYDATGERGRGRRSVYVVGSNILAVQEWALLRLSKRSSKCYPRAMVGKIPLMMAGKAISYGM
jgi:hypothetical protein